MESSDQEHVPATKVPKKASKKAAEPEEPEEPAEEEDDEEDVGEDEYAQTRLPSHSHRMR